MKSMQKQIQELILAQRRTEDEGDFSGHGNIPTRGSGSHVGGTNSWHSNDIKVDIPEYNGKLDPDEFIEWLRTVERVFDYK